MKEKKVKVVVDVPDPILIIRSVEKEFFDLNERNE